MKTKNQGVNMKITMIIDGLKVEARLFKTLDAAERYMKKTNLKLIFFRAHEYYVG
jgi:hypothetical protein